MSIGAVTLKRRRDESDIANDIQNPNKKQRFEEITFIRFVPGLSLIKNFVTDTEASTLLDQLNNQEWSDILKRRVQHYGHTYKYRNSSSDKFVKSKPVPDFLDVAGQLLVQEELFDEKPDQVIINEYTPGQKISAHTDDINIFGPQIASLSLGCDATMFFSYKGTKISVFLPKNSLAILEDDARYKWKHELKPITGGTRVSVTFRNIKKQ
jgi:alkylated DNA repair dioxygenase AlkB